MVVVAAIARIAATYRVFSQTVDEPVHVAAGQQWLHEGRYDLDIEHPPLARIFFALTFGGADVEGGRVERGNQLFWLDDHYLTNLSRARAGNLPFYLLGMYVVFAWTRRIAGLAAAVISAALFAALPPMLAHAGLATTDMAAASTTAFALYALQLWLDAPSWRRAVVLGVAIGIGLLSKFSFLLLFPLGASILIAFQFRAIRWRHCAAIVPIALLVVMAMYRFERGSLLDARAATSVVGTAEQRAAQYAQTPGYEWIRPDILIAYYDYANAAARAGVVGVDFVDWAKAAGYPSPLAGRSGRDTMIGAPKPEPKPRSEPFRALWHRAVVVQKYPGIAFITGADFVRQHSAMGHGEAWLFGENRPNGFWYYFPVVVFFKTPLPFLVFAAAGFLFLTRRRALGIILIPLAMLAISMTSRINIGVRHVLPIYPFLTIAAACGVVLLWQHSRALVLILGAWYFIGTAVAHPDYLAYFNELAGRHPERIAVDSNLDWGQDLLRLRRAVGGQPVHLAYFGSADWQRHLPNASPIPARCTTGWVAVSEMMYLRQRDTELRWLTRYEPVARAGKSIRLYRIAACP
ncbi:MAG TPA: glycosyltransferase family 39 protein [Thermoanaerobaculia bacterium]|nr:glycosyltransferase family 39 protein [Thermoanaerobaculia bacterium]